MGYWSNSRAVIPHGCAALGAGCRRGTDHRILSSVRFCGLPGCAILKAFESITNALPGPWPGPTREVHMSGHSKWATIKHKKAALDAKRGKTFTRIIKEISTAARSGGDPDANPRLRTAILAAKAVSMPADNIKKAIMRGTGELEGGQIEEVMFEGYGPGGAAVLVNVATDNRNRTVSEIRHAFSKNGGNMGAEGSVAWMFERKSQIFVPGEKITEDKLMDIVLEAGADDMRSDGERWQVLGAPEAQDAVRKTLDKNGSQH